MCPNGEMCGNSAHRPYFEIKTGGCFGSGTTVHQRYMARTGSAGTPGEYFQGTSWQGATLRKISYPMSGITEYVATGELPYYGEGPHKVARLLVNAERNAFLDLNVSDFVIERNGMLRIVRDNGADLDYYNVNAATLEITKMATESKPEGYETPVDVPIGITTENVTPGTMQPVFYFAGSSGGNYVLIPYVSDGPMLWRQDTGVVTVG